MELMSSLLLCVLVALLPQTLGKTKLKYRQGVDVSNSKFNNSVFLQQNPKPRKYILLNVNGASLVNNISDLQSLFNDHDCKHCHDCMERIQNLIITSPSGEELRKDVLTNEVRYRTKREVEQTIPTVGESKTKKKTRRQRLNKSVTVTKYNIDGEVYALRVKEIQAQADNDSLPVAICQVYNVKKSYSCDSPDIDSLLAAAKKRVTKKKSKKQEDNKFDSTITSTAKVEIQSVFKKREVDNSQGLENVMPSVEEFY